MHYISLKYFLLFVGVGFFAQLVDGALGMAYGVLSSTLLLSLGIQPLIASASIHIAEIVTTGISGISHAIFKNIDRELFKKLALPGIIGSIAGAFLLSTIPVKIAKMIISAYLCVTGIYLLYMLIRQKLPAVPKANQKTLSLLGIFGGFLDALGGGGWGPIVTSSLVGLGITPRFAVGTTIVSEFLVTVAASTVFIFVINITITSWSIILGLLIGGALAAPIAAYVAKIIPMKLFTFIVGLLIVFLSLRMIVF